MPRSRQPFSPFAAAVLALLAGLIATFVLFAGIRRLEHDKIELEFQQRANIRILTIQQQLDQTIHTLRVLNQAFVSFQDVSREQFRNFSQPLLQRHSYIQALNFHRVVDAEGRDAYELEMRRVYPDYVMRQMKDGRLVPAEAARQHLIVDYVEPLRGNEAALGLDVAPNTHLAEAVRWATDSGQPTSTALLTLAQGGGRQTGFLVVMPLYRHGMPTDTVDERRAAFIGDTAAVFKAEVLVEKILSESGMLNDPSLSISVYASSDIDDRNLAFRSGSRPLSRDELAAQSKSPIPHWLFRDQPEPVMHDFDLAGRPWKIAISRQPESFMARHAGSVATLAGGVLMSLLIVGFFHAMSMRSRRVHSLVEQRTAELRLANDRLVEDIAARKRAEDALQLRQRAIEASANAIIITSAAAPNYPIEYVNPAFERITGYSLEDVINRSCSLLWADDRAQPEIQEIIASVRELRETRVTLRTYGKDGRMFWSDAFLAPVRDETGVVNHYVVAINDITATKRYQAELEFQANRDTLTGLANRNLLHDRLRQASAYATRYGHPVWLLFMNLDRFKFVNDTLGHRAGDELLKVVADRLRGAVRETDTIARMSADEFVLILPERTEEHLSPVLVQRIMDAVAQPIVIEGYEFVMGSSIGIAVCPSDGMDADTLIKHAGIAMYRAKETGRNNFQFFTPAMNDHAMERLRIENNLRSALEREEFFLHYQPQVDLATGRVLGMEVLIRWQHPVLGMVPPDRFIELAEEIGLIVPIGAWVLRTACRQCVAWQRAGLGQLRVAVNLSPLQFYQEDLVHTVKGVLAESGLAPHLLELELTESMMMNDIEHAVCILRDLKSIGVHLSIDDFGTGYSSLSYLKRFPIDLLKIDQSFVRDITIDPDDEAIVLSIISLAHSLRLKVIAEGVETEAQLAYLKRHGCDYMQGYYFSRPLPAQAFEQLLRQRRSLSQDTSHLLPLV
ncbi:EAL domain-containing protein [Noviherbaspirillum sp. CPCC 100848]|uniref:EAL domain-containing protein n=1 Tax=Noviherbaspirillum album TaxID=3080276 RepID=A0ABU6J5D7_9BURK|nr:EAL domain-containing protein [Noviherbaspirillum sp. CPCC 100848]MEC4718570.1 EAL domain-containing protein [Noviherbaspirillum sp. CPCC 100848]